MTKDFSKHQKIIDRFRGEALSKDFDVLFQSATKNLPKTETFLLKMELKRLASPCTRLIDLRGHVDGECKMFEDEGRMHFLDDLAIKSYQENMNYYGSYTFGVYEAVKKTKNNFRVIYESEKANIQSNLAVADETQLTKVTDKTQYSASLCEFSYAINRSEERMNFATAITITLENDERVESTSADISMSGCKFRLNNKALTIGQTLRIFFNGLASDFQFSDQQGFEYQVCNIHDASPTQVIGVKLVDGQASDSFQKFLDNFIQANKRRFKINIERAINVLGLRVLEQFVLPKTNELPVFIKHSSQNSAPRFALTAPNNQGIYQYWQDEKRHSTLHCLLKPERLAYLLQPSGVAKTLIVYSFVHTNKAQSYFYTADEHELQKDPNFAKQFLGFAAAKKSFSVSILTAAKIDTTQTESPFAISPMLIEQNENFNLPSSENVLAVVADLTVIATVKDITEKSMVEHYQTFPYADIDKVRLKNFGHKRLLTPPEVDQLGINYKDNRLEARFKYQTPALVSTEEVSLKGNSQDFSVSGMKILLDSPAELKRGDIVKLSFPTLQKITSAFDLKDLPYEIMHVNKKKNVISLKVFVKQHQHIGRSFFKLLIEKNKDKLKTDDYANLLPGLDKALRNLYTNSLVSPFLVIKTSGSRYKIETITSSHLHDDFITQMKQLSDRQNYYNLYPLLNNLQATTSIYNALKKMHVPDVSLTTTLYIAINLDMDAIAQAVTTKIENDFTTPASKKIFIQNALKTGSFYCVQGKLSRTGKPEMDYLNPELSYISSYAIHRGKQIEQDIWSVAGVVQLFDITKEVLIRHKLG